MLRASSPVTFLFGRACIASVCDTFSRAAGWYWACAGPMGKTSRSRSQARLCITEDVSMRRAAIASVAVLLCISAAHASSKELPDRSAEVDRLFSKWSAATPGCAIAAAVNGNVVVAKAYGMADLEHGTKNTVDTIFEAGSVSKQFTAAAVLMLAHDGKLSLDEPVRKYLPELPDYGVPITLRHMLTHTSGLRDWGEVAMLAGWPRGTQARTDADVLEIVARQRELNFRSGTRWSYSNTGYTLAEIVVSRVSGQSLAEFTRQRIFAPLGMTHTSWRD